MKSEKIEAVIRPDMTVVLEPYAFSSLLMSAAEVFSRETTGFLVGHQNRQFVSGRMSDCMSIDAVYPIQTADRGRNQVGFGNNAARLRVENTVKAVGLSMVGGFHSHSNTSSRLSKEDKEYCWEYLEEIESKMGLERWLEIVVGIRAVKRPGATKQLKQLNMKELRPGFYPRNEAPAVEGYLIIDRKTAFDIEISGFWFDHDEIAEALISYSRY